MKRSTEDQVRVTAGTSMELRRIRTSYPFELAMYIIRFLQDEYGAVVTEVDMGGVAGEMGSITLAIPSPATAGQSEDSAPV